MIQHLCANLYQAVSTHSHPKAAALAVFCKAQLRDCFNTQPPEDGCCIGELYCPIPACFNTQPPEGGCINRKSLTDKPRRFNTQPPEGGCKHALRGPSATCGFNTQPPEGGCVIPGCPVPVSRPFQHTAARRRLPSLATVVICPQLFQHTAARRRLPAQEENVRQIHAMFQHTAARRRLRKTSCYCK